MMSEPYFTDFLMGGYAQSVGTLSHWFCAQCSFNEIATHSSSNKYSIRLVKTVVETNELEVHLADTMQAVINKCAETVIP